MSSNLQKLAQRLMALDDKITNCMRCGMCQAVCPIFGATGQEADVARGKLYLINNLAHMILTDPQALADKLGRCLLCSSCQAVCPPGVPIMEIFREAREIVYNYLGLNPVKKMIFGVLLAKPGLFNFALRFGHPAQQILFKKSNNAQGTVCAPMFNFMLGDRNLPPMAKKPLHAIYGTLDEPRKQDGIKVMFFPGCVGDKMYVEMAEACIKALRHHGVAIYMPERLACCGIPAICSGDASGMLKELKANLEIMAKGDFDYIVTPCASCTSTILELWPEYAARLGPGEKKIAEDFAAKTMDINVFMVNVLGVQPKEADSNARTVTYHDPCHLVKSLGVSSEPRTMIRANRECELVEMDEHDRCCGCGGSFTLFHYDYAKKIGQRKRDNIVKSGAKVVATSCPACMMQLEDMLAHNNDQVKVKHTMQIYADTLD
ncbi:MAG: (Fe-S)-binding protein [Desulfovibrio sp.]|nr:(Fe-S)-binding protein [Desulfovibrio sp.]